MSDPYLGEIRLFPYSNTVPKGWAVCDGQTLSIQQNTALFSLLGTLYGGNGVQTFALPDLRGRVPVHFDNAVPQGTAQGEENHTLTINEMPTHNHVANASNVAASAPGVASPSIWAATGTAAYGPASSLVSMSPQAIGQTGGNLPHSNMQPYLAVAFCIALTGIYPSRS